MKQFWLLKVILVFYGQNSQEENNTISFRIHLFKHLHLRRVVHGTACPMIQNNTN